jgi:hypothetical protein
MVGNVTNRFTQGGNYSLAWNLQISKLQGCRVDSRYLQWSIVSADLPLGSFSLSLMPKAILAQKANFKEYRLAKKIHVSARVAWLRSLSLARSEEDGKSATNHYFILIAIEQRRRQARNVKRATHKLKSFGASRIIAPDSSGGGSSTLRRKISRRVANGRTLDDSRKLRILLSCSLLF